VPTRPLLCERADQPIDVSKASVDGSVARRRICSAWAAGHELSARGAAPAGILQREYIAVGDEFGYMRRCAE